MSNRLCFIGFNILFISVIRISVKCHIGATLVWMKKVKSKCVTKVSVCSVIADGNKTLMITIQNFRFPLIRPHKNRKYH